MLCDEPVCLSVDGTAECRRLRSWVGKTNTSVAVTRFQRPPGADVATTPSASVVDAATQLTRRRAAAIRFSKTAAMTLYDVTMAA